MKFIRKLICKITAMFRPGYEVSDPWAGRETTPAESMKAAERRAHDAKVFAEICKRESDRLNSRKFCIPDNLDHEFQKADELALKLKFDF